MITTPIEYSPVSATSVVAGGSRYADKRLMYYGEKRLLTFETYVRKEYERNGGERIMVITKGVEYRPDLVAHDYYGYSDNWWRILEVNGMNDIYQFKAGVTIFLPENEV